MMNGMKNWFRRVFSGCYGVDQLSLTILYIDVALCVLNIFLHSALVSLLVWILWIVVIFRMLSRNRSRRYLENRRYLQLLDRIRDRDNRYYKCPKCRQLVRVPRGKGKLAITCPKCKEKFIRKT